MKGFEPPNLKRTKFTVWSNSPSLPHSQNTHLIYNKFKKLCAFGGIEPTHIWLLLICIVLSCILSLDVKPTCTEQLQLPIYCDKPAFIVEPRGIEPWPSDFQSDEHNQLFYSSICGCEWTRTSYLLLNR